MVLTRIINGKWKENRIFTTNKSEFSRMITIRKYRVQDIVPAMEIWNEVVRDGIAFPQDEELAGQTVTE